MGQKPSGLLDTRIIYCGDNLDQLSKLPDGSVDLIYIDPPFNSNRNYEVFWGETKEKRAFEDRHASTAAYIDFMRPRCVELHRVLKRTGGFYYHCDWHASHYVKVMLDQIFGENQFVNEVIWKRQSAHNDAKQGSKHFGRVHDSILFYAKGRDYVFHHQYKPYDQEYVEDFYRHVEPSTGRRYRLGDLTAPGGAAPSKGNPHYEFLGVTRYWRYSEENMKRLYEQGRIVQTKPGRVPQYKRYLDEGRASRRPGVAGILQTATTPAGQEPSWKTAADAHIRALESGHDWVQGKDGTWTKQEVRTAGPLSTGEKLGIYFAYQDQQGYGQAPMAEPGQAEAAAQAQGQQQIVQNQGAYTNFANAANQNLAAFGTNVVGLVAPQYGNQLQQNVQAAAPYDPDSKAGFVGGVVGGTLPLVPAMLAPEAGGLQLATAGTAGAGQAGSVREQVAQQRAQGQQISSRQEWTDAALQAATMFAAQKFGLSRLGGAGSLPALTAVERQSLVNVIEQAVARRMAGMGATGGEFAAMQIANNTANWLTGVKPDQNLLEGVPQSFATGAVIDTAGAALHGATAPREAGAIPVPSQEQLNSLKTGVQATHVPQNEPPPLPSILELASPKYRLQQGGESRGIPLDFSRPVEKAIWISTLPTRGKLSIEADRYLGSLGMTDDAIRDAGRQLRQQADLAAKNPPQPGDSMTVSLRPRESQPALATKSAGMAEGQSVAESPALAESAGQTGANQVQSPTVGKAASVEEPSLPSSVEKLPPLLDKATPRFPVRSSSVEATSVPIQFESPIDKALYAATATKRGVIAAQADAHLQQIGFTSEEIQSAGQALRDRMQRLADAAQLEDGDTFRVPAKAANEAATRVAIPHESRVRLPQVVEAEARTPAKAPEAIEKPAAAPEQPAKDHDAVLAENNPGAKRVDPSSLPPEHQQVLNDYKALTGKEMVPYVGGKGRGFHVDGDAYYNVERNNTPQLRRETIAHEATHQLQDTRPDLVNAMDRALPAGMRKQLLSDYQSAYSRQEGKPLSTDQHTKEIQAYAVGRAFARKSVADAVMERNPGAFSKAASAILTKLRGLTSAGRATNEIIKFLQAAKSKADGMEQPASQRVREKDAANFLPTPHDRIRDEADEYTRKAGIPYEPDMTYAPLNEGRAKQIASDYAALKNEPNAEATKKSYDAFKQETMDQYHYLQDKGIKFEPWTKPGQPYKDSAEMMQDARDNKHLYFFQGGELPADHPLAQQAPGTPYSYNDIFRAVHDYFGHAKEGYGFGPRGEENAWRQHSQMYSEAARPAMTTETRGQNSWVNFGPHGEHNQANPADTIFAEQKAGLMNPEYGKVLAESPEWTGDTPAQRQTLAMMAKDKAGFNLPNQPGANFLPGGHTAATFANEDVKPALTKLAENFRDAWDGIKGMIAPQTLSKASGITARLMRERGGTLARNMDKIHAAFDETEKALNRLPVDEQRAITDAAERGQQQANPALQPVADAIRQMFDDRLQQMQKINPNFHGIENYMGHLYKDPNRAAPILETLMRRNLEGSKSFLRKRTIPYQSDAIAQGLEPVTDNPVSMMKLKLAQMDKYITTQNVMNDLKGMGLMQKVPARAVYEKEQNGYARIDDKVGTIFAPPNRRGGISVAGYWMAPEPVARVINNHLSPGLRDSESVGGLYKTYLAVGHAMNSAQLLSGYYGTKIRNEDDPILKQLGDVGKFLGKQVEPFGVRGVSQMLNEGQGARSFLPLIGLNPARRDVTESPAEQRAQELLSQRMPAAPRTTEQEDRSRRVSEFAAGLRNREPEIYQKIRAAIQGGQLSQADIENIRERQKFSTPLQHTVSRLDVHDAMQVWSLANDAEKRRLMAIMTTKVRASKTLTLDERKAYMTQLQSDFQQLRNAALAGAGVN